MRPVRKFSQKDRTRVNRQIFASEVRVVGSDGSALGVLKLRDALAKAKEEGLDLVEVAPQAKPPVCKIIDYGKFKYEKKKDEKRAKKKQVVIKMHEIKFGISTDEHDVEHKLRKIKEFLAEGDRVKISVFFRGRQMVHRDLGKKVLDNMTKKLNDIAIVEQKPKFEGRNLFMVCAPNKDSTGKSKK